MRAATLAVRRRTAILVAWLLTIAVAAVIVARAPFSTDLTAFLPNAATPAEQVLVNQLRDGVASRMVLIALAGPDPKALAKTSQAMIEALARDQRFEYVTNGSADRFAADAALLDRFRYVLSPAVNAERFTTESLRHALTISLEWLNSPASTLLVRRLPADPTGELFAVLNLLTAERRPQTVDGVWFSADGKRALAIAETRAPGFDMAAQMDSQAAIRAAFDAAADRVRVDRAGVDRASVDRTAAPAVQLTLAGPAVFALSARDSIERDSWRLSIIASVCVVVILLIAYRSVVFTVAAALPVATGVLTGLAAVAMSFPTVHGITLGFGATLIGEAIDYPTYLLAQRRAGEPLALAAARIWPTLRLAVLTTTFSGLTMLLSSFQGLAQLGVLLVAGILAAGVVTHWVIPALGLERFDGKPRPAPPVWLDPARLPSSGRIGMLLVLAFLVGALAFLATRSTSIWDDDLERLTPIGEDVKNLDGQLRGELGAPDVRYLIVIRGASRDEVLRASERLEPHLAQLVADQTLTSFDLAARFLPSAARQAERRAALPERNVLAERLRSAQSDLPYQSGLFTPFLDAVDAARIAPALTLDDLAGSTLGLKVRALLSEQRRDGQPSDWFALITLSGVNDPIALGARVRPVLDRSMTFLDMKTAAIALVGNYRGESLKLSALGIVAMVGVLWFGLRSARATLCVLLPAASAAMVATAGLFALGIQLSLFHLISLLLVLGAGLNYALFFQRPEPNPDDRARTGLALVVCAATTIAAFGGLATSTMPVLRAIGLTTSAGIILAFVFAAISAPRERVKH